MFFDGLPQFFDNQVIGLLSRHQVEGGHQVKGQDENIGDDSNLHGQAGAMRVKIPPISKSLQIFPPTII